MNNLKSKVQLTISTEQAQQYANSSPNRSSGAVPVLNSTSSCMGSVAAEATHTALVPPAVPMEPNSPATPATPQAGFSFHRGYKVDFSTKQVLPEPSSAEDSPSPLPSSPVRQFSFGSLKTQTQAAP